VCAVFFVVVAGSRDMAVDLFVHVLFVDAAVRREARILFIEYTGSR